MRWIKEARRQADWVLVSFHSHQFAHKSVAYAATKIELKEPADFVPAFARQAIDAGADIFVGHGSHTPLGIEIYKGKPIFYSVGNFIFQNESVRSFPAEAYARFGLGHTPPRPTSSTPAPAAAPKATSRTKVFGKISRSPANSAAAGAAEIRIHPIEQGFGASLGQRGRPMLATGAIADRVITRVTDLSATYPGVSSQRQGRPSSRLTPVAG